MDQRRRGIRIMAATSILAGVCAGMAWADPPGGDGSKWTVHASNPYDDITAVKVMGTPYQMGWWYGYLLATEIRDNITKFIDFSGMSEPELQALIDNNIWPRMAPYIPQAFHDELDGIVDGAAEADPPVSPPITLTDLRRMHALVELQEFNCTSLGALGPATYDGRLIQIRVLDTDMDTGGQDNPVITVYRPDEGPAYCNVGFAGLIGSLAGINSERIAACEVGETTPEADLQDPATYDLFEGIPMTLLLKKVLAESAGGGGVTALEKALQVIQDGPRTTNYTYGVGYGGALSDPNDRDSKTIVTTRDYWYLWGVDEFVSYNDPAEPNTIWDANVPLWNETYPAFPGVTYRPQYIDRTVDLIDPASPNYVGPIDPNAAIEIVRRVAMGSNLLDVVFDGEALKLWVAYAEGPTSRAADREFVPFDFGEAIRTCTLTVSTKNGSNGHVEVDPNLPEYEPNALVTLTAVPDPEYGFKHWRIYDPNYPGDVNHAVNDGNLVITIAMMSDREVTAVFNCGKSAGASFPLILVALAGLRWVKRRA